MKCHKIRNVPLEACTVEQKIAYNLALCWRDIILKEYNNALTPSKKTEVISLYVNKLMHNYTLGYDYIPGEYNEDAIRSALCAGLEGFINTRYYIFVSYKEIEELFPLTTG
ncbi:MAG: hypothetical protein ACI4I6_07580 [Hominimerdicola sp.]